MTRTSRTLVLLFGLVTVSARAQDAPTTGPTGRIVGRIVDEQSGQGIAHVAIQVVGTRIGTISGIDGRYNIPRVPAGTVTLQARLIGYGPKTVTGIILQPDKSLQQDITLLPSA